ncbi:MAG TPA: hypothetical protein VF613_17755 [Longimicrobium sp.]|jgi:uncharacterized protein YwgA
MAGGQQTWNQYALIIELAERMQGRPFGRTALQKLTYLLQELHGVDTGYEFPLHTYGPYSSDLSADLHTLTAKQGVEVTNDTRQGGFQISPGAKSEWIRALGADSVRPHVEAIGEIVDEFGGMTTKELELRATLVFAERDARRRGTRLAEDALVEEVHEIKPNFSREQIGAALRELREGNHIATA